MTSIPVIPLGETNCWIISLIPYLKESRNNDEILDFQLKCIDEKLFGIGWQNCPDTDANYSRARNIFQNIKKGDYILMRLKNSHYYIGRVENPPYLNTSSDILTWCGNVEKWCDFGNEENLPSEIVGRMSQRHHPTVQQVCDMRQKLQIIKLFEDYSCEKERIVPENFRVLLGENNFARCLTYTELEDLVYRYIISKHKKDGYYLLPSSCKTSHQKFEFTLVNDNPIKKPITCQVKNREFIDIAAYNDETDFEKIYIFSSLGYKNINPNTNYKLITIIKPEELFETLKKFDYLLSKMKKHYTTNSDDSTVNIKDFESCGWKIRKKFIGNSFERLKINSNENSVAISSNKIKFFCDFQALVLLDKKETFTDELLQRIKEFIVNISTQKDIDHED